MVSALRACAVLEKARVFYERFTAVFAADCTVWHNDAFADVVISIRMAVLSDAAACLYRYLYSRPKTFARINI